MSFKIGSFILSLTIVILFASSGWISTVSALQQQMTPLGVRITEPARGQHLAIGKNLTIEGTSSYSSTSNCGVYVIVDGIKPYQKTIPIGQAGGNNYSQWMYTLAPAYAGTIKEGINRITAKLVCQAGPVNLTKFYSINVTGMNGINPKQSSIASNNTADVHVSSNSMSYLYNLAPIVNQLPAGHKHTISTSRSSSSDTSDESGHHHHYTGKNHVKYRTSRHNTYEGGGYFNERPGGGFNEGPGGPGGGFNEGPGGPGGGFNEGPGGGYDSDNPFGAGY
jgi:hypothetical protein